MPIKEIKKTETIVLQSMVQEKIIGYECSNGLRFKTKEEAEKYEEEHKEWFKLMNSDRFKVMLHKIDKYETLQESLNLLLVEPFDSVQKGFWFYVENPDEETKLLRNYYSNLYIDKDALQSGEWHLFLECYYNVNSNYFWSVYSKSEILERINNLKVILPE